jgi:hypothetical protein
MLFLQQVACSLASFCLHQDKANPMYLSLSQLQQPLS